MINLIHANFIKLFKTNVFKVSLGFMVFMPAFTVLVSSARDNAAKDMNSVFNIGLMFIGFVIAVLVTLFIGQDYSDNVIRNKLTAGHTRLTIYISDLIVSFCAGILLQLAYIASGCLFALPLFGRFTQSIEEIVKVQLLGLCLIAVYTALTTFITMLITNKTYAVVVSIITATAIFMAGTGAYQYVMERRAAEALLTTEVAEEEFKQSENKLAYILYDTVPASQAITLSEGGIPENCMKILGYDMLSTTAFTLLGILLYRKKDFK